MKAVQILGEKSSPKIFLNNNVPKPPVASSSILVQVHAAGITGDEITWPEVYQSQSRIPGHELSGTIVQLGPDYRGELFVGQEVWALIRPSEGQAQAEFALCLQEEVVPKPTSLTHIDASVLPIPLMTAWEALLDHGKFVKGQTVLITGASGAVGKMVIQVAKLLGAAEIVAVASIEHQGELTKLGASRVLDYHTKGWEEDVARVDLVVDAVGGEMLPKLWKVVKNDGCIVTVGDPAPKWAFEAVTPVEAEGMPKVRYRYFIVSLNRDRLELSRKLFDQGSLIALLVTPFTIDMAVEAWSYARQRRRGCKVAVSFR